MLTSGYFQIICNRWIDEAKGHRCVLAEGHQGDCRIEGVTPMPDVSDADRKAAADFHFTNSIGPMQSRRMVADEMLAGDRDDSPTVQAFARHRLAGMEQAAVIAERLSNSAIFNERDREATCRRIAAAIRAAKEGV